MERIRRIVHGALSNVAVRSQIFVDLDGVLADFYGHYKSQFGVELTYENEDKLFDSNLLLKHGSFHRDQPLLSDAMDLWIGIHRYHTNPIILTGIPRTNQEYVSQKEDWVRRNIGSHVKVICCRSQDKCLYGCPYDILIDDRLKYRQYWIDMGGTFIHHKSAKQTLEILEGLYV